MGGICCKDAPPEINPDGNPKPLQTKDQMKLDAADLRKAAVNCDLESMHSLLERMPKKQICSGAKKNEGDESEVGMTALHFSTAANHLRGCTKLVLYGADIEAKDAKGYTPLHVQMELGYRKVAQFLVKRGADVNAQDKNGSTPLMVAMHNGHKAAVDLMFDLDQQLCKQGQDGLSLFLISKDGWSYPLILAMLGWWSSLDSILNKINKICALPESDPGAHKCLNVRSSTGDTLLGWVLRYTLSGSLPIAEALPLVKRLFALGVSPKTPSFGENVPPLALAAAIGDKELWATIIQAAGQGETGAKDGLGRSLLHYASAKGHLELVQQLSTNLRADEADAHGNTPLHLAAMKGHAACLQELLNSAASAQTGSGAKHLSPVEKVLLQPNKEGLAVLHLVLQAGPLLKSQMAALKSIEKMEMPNLQKEAHLVVDKQVKATPLILAVAGHQHAVVKALLERGADVNEQTSSNETALVRCLASVTKQTASMDAAILKLLIDAGAKLDAGAGNEANHPLMAICKNDCNDFAQLALEYLAGKAEGGKLDWDMANPVNGRTPLMEAAMHNNMCVVKAILSDARIKEAHLEKVCHKGLTALCYAAWGAGADTMKVLLNNKANIEHKDKQGRSVLSFCLKLDVPESLLCAALLLRSGAEPGGEVDSSGEGLLHRAVRYGAPDFIRLWARYGGSLLSKCSTPITANIVVPTAMKYDPEVSGIAAKIEDDLKGAKDKILDQNCTPVPMNEEELEDDEGLDAKGHEIGTVASAEEYSDNSAHKQTGQIAVDQMQKSGSGRKSAEHASTASLKGMDVSCQPGAVAEGMEKDLEDGGSDASTTFQRIPSFYSGPSIKQERTWLRQGSGWWNEWIDQKVEDATAVDDKVPVDPSDEDWDLEDKDGLLTLDDLLMEILDRQKSGQSIDAAAICEGLMDNALSMSKSLSKVVPIDGNLTKSISKAVPFGDLMLAEKEECSLLPSSLEEHGSDFALALVQTLLSKRVGTDSTLDLDSYYNPKKPYQGEPACMKADTNPNYVQLVSLLTSMHTRLEGYDIKPETPLQGADLRERNIRWWIKSQSPEAFPLKLGRWLTLSKLTEQAVKVARAQVASSAKELIRKRVAFIGQPDLPTRPELERTTALTYAVQLCRPACVKAILDCDVSRKLLGIRDLYGHTALEYAMALLVRDKSNVQLQQIVDLILIRRPEFEKAISASYHNSMHPLCLAVVACDLPRIAWMVCCCSAPLESSWMYAPDVPCYYQGLWEKLIGSTEASFAPLHLALMHKRMDITKLLLDLGADGNITSWGTSNAIFAKGIFAKREQFLKELGKHRNNALKGKPDPMGSKDACACHLRKKQQQESHDAMKRAHEDKTSAHRKTLAALKEAGNSWKGKALAAGLQVGTLLKRIEDILNELLGGPDPWISALHLAARFGQAELCVLLLDRGATVTGGAAAATAVRTPLEEALKYARANFRSDNCGAVRHNWLAIQRKAASCIPEMSLTAKAVQANQTMGKMMDVTALGIKMAIMAARTVINILLESFKRPIAHYDNALKAAHVLIKHRCILRPNDSQTSILFRDMADNGTWAWVGGNAALIHDFQWLKKANETVDKLVVECELKKAGEAKTPKEYKKIVKGFENKVKSRFFTHGFKEFQEVYNKDMKKAVYDLQLKAKTLKLHMTSRTLFCRVQTKQARKMLKAQGWEWMKRVNKELEQAWERSQSQPAVFPEPPTSGATLKMAEFDMDNEDEFLGGGKEAIVADINQQASLTRQRTGKRSSMVANAQHFMVPVYAHEENALGSSSAEALSAILCIEQSDFSVLIKHDSQATLDDIGILVKKAKDAVEEAIKLAEAAKQEVKAQKQFDKMLKEVKGKVEDELESDDEEEGEDQISMFESLDEALSLLDGDVEMDVDGLCAFAEEFEEIIDKIFDIVEEAG